MTTLPPRRVDATLGCRHDVAKQKGERRLPLMKSGAGNESRTRDLNLGKVALYQLSYSRIDNRNYSENSLLARGSVHPRTDRSAIGVDATTCHAVASCGTSAAFIRVIAFSRFCIDVANEMRT